MANLTDTNINGDLRVSGTVFGVQAGNYATCATAAGTAAKVITISGFVLTTGIHVFVKFTVTNTAAVASLTLDVSGTGAKSLKYRGGNLPAVGTLASGRVYEFVYDGTNWELVGDLDTNTQTVTGVKGNAETTYRTGQVNITPANIGVSATSTSVTVGTTTASIPQATSTSPKMDGTAAVGSETTWAKGDHVHPSDTSRVPTSRTVNGHALSADVTVTAADVSAVRYDTNAQGLTDTQKSNARTNIGAGTSSLTIGTTATTAAAGNHAHGNIANGGTLTDTAAAAAGNDYVVIRDAANAKIQTSTIKGTDVADAVSKKHSHSTLTLSTTAQAYDGSHTLALPSTDPYTSARTPTSHTHGNIHNDGTIVGGNDGSGKAVANNDRLVVAESTNTGYKAVLTTTSFDGSTTTKALTPKGTFESFAKAGDITAAIQALDVSSVGGSGKYISAISEADGKISATATSMDTAPTASSTNAVTSGGVKTALDAKQDDIKYQLVEFGAVTYSDVTAIINSGKVPAVYGDNSLYVYDGSVYTVNGTNEYRFMKASGNVDSPRITYVRVNNSNGWGSSSIGLASNSALSTKADASVVTALSSDVANHNTWFHVETLHTDGDNITQFLKMSFSGRVGRASALVSIGGNNGNDSSAFRLSWFYDPAVGSGNISNLGRELFSTGSIGKRPLIYYDSNSFYIGLSDAGNWGANIAVMLACENPEYVTYSTVTRSEATGSGKTALPLEWFATYSKTINVLDTSGTVGTDPNTLYFT